MHSRIFKAAFFISAVMLTSCQAEPEPDETTVTTETTIITEEDHSLLRSFTINEAFERITVSGEKFVFPFALTELDEGGSMSGYKYENSTLYFPDGGTAEAMVRDGIVYYLKFSTGSAPADFAIMGISLGMSDDIIYSIGIPDDISFNNGNGWARYDGFLGQYFNLAFNDGKLTDITIVQQ